MAAALILETFPEAGLAPPPWPADAPAPPPPFRGVALSSTEPEVLLAVLRPEANLAVWHRDMPHGISAASLTPLLAAAPFTAVSEGAPDAAVAALAARLPADPPLDLLLDVHRLAAVFAGIATDGHRVRVRLEAVTGPGCRRWHADAVGLRMLCTYRGPGTEWLPLAGGAEAARALDPASPPPSSRPARLPAGSVAILKGEAHPGNAGWGCVHRSPPAGPGARARLLLCLDEPGRFPLEPSGPEGGPP